MVYQVSLTLTDGSKYYLEKINVTKEEVNNIKMKYEIPDHLHNKAVYIARQFSESQLGIILDFLQKNDYVKSYKVKKINPYLLEDDVAPFSKLARSNIEGTNWETISLGQINSMFIMGYGLAKINYELRRTERNHQGAILLLDLINVSKNKKNISKLQNYLLNVKHIEDIHEFANKTLNLPKEEISLVADELKKIINEKQENITKVKSSKIIKLKDIS